ncbi:MAG: trypsin-like peptidase domain-containing protein [Chloroflexi bacterium]|nr:trypsin-like peptidase domain-containing protein [Chloroflexota bacterium]
MSVSRKLLLLLPLWLFLLSVACTDTPASPEPTPTFPPTPHSTPTALELTRAASTPQPVGEGAYLSTVEVVKQLKPSVVQIVIEVVRMDFFGRPSPDTGVGTGLILDTGGHILTNNHVVQGAQTIIVILNDGTRREGTIVGTDPSTDIAIVRIEANGLVPALLGDSRTLQVGEDVIAIGHALGLAGGPTVSKGVVSALERTIQVDTQNTIVDLIQTDASINPGNSGGPLVNLKGEVIGINTAIIEASQGIGFAININDARIVAQQLIEWSNVRRGYLGVVPFNLTSALASRFDVPVNHGIIIQQATPGSGAAAAGLREGDVIIGLGDTEIRNTGDLSKFLLEHQAGETVDIVYYRGPERIEGEIRIGERP